MSIALLNDYRSVANTVAPATAQTTPAVTSVPSQTEARGFALYVGIDEDTAAAAGVSLAELVQALRKTVGELVPAAGNETYAAVALAPKGIGGKNIDVVRTALHDPRSLNRLVEANKEDVAGKGIVIDITRHRVFADGSNAELTFKEFELLNYLIQNQGETITRRELIDAVWADEADAPNERTVDVHVRRLRAKIAGYEDVIRTVRGGGYRFDKHPDVLVEA
jgi:DNA-binding winged helix-turn-helix (wHTH) protein